MKIKELLPQQVIVSSTTDTVSSLAQKMRNHRIGILPVLADNHLVGVVTDRDITVRAVASTPNAGYVHALDIMTPHPVTIDEDADTEDAAVLMREHKLHRLIVTRGNGTVSGVVSLTDLSLLGADAFEVLRRLSEKPLIEQFPEEDLHLHGPLT